MVSRGSLLFFKSVGQGSRSLRLFNSPSVYIQTISRASLYIHQRAILCSKNLCFEISSSTVTGTKNYKTVSRHKNSVKKPFTNASRGAFRVQRTLVLYNMIIYSQTCVKQAPLGKPKGGCLRQVLA